MNTTMTDGKESKKAAITWVIILCVFSLACVGFEFDDGREHFDTYEVSLPTDDGQLTNSISVPVEDITLEGIPTRRIIVAYELRNPSTETSVDISLHMGLEGGDPEPQRDDERIALELEAEDVETDEIRWLDPPPLAPEFLIEIEATGSLEARFDVYIAPARD